MVGLAVAQGLGIIATLLLPVSILWVIIPIVIFLFCVLAYAKSPLTTTLVPLIFIAGWLSLIPWTSTSYPSNHIIHFLDSGPTEVRGTLCERPSQYGDRTRFTLDVKSVGSADNILPVRGKIRVTIRPAIQELAQGTVVRFTGQPRSLRNFSNPGGFDYVRYMRFRDIFGSIYLRGRSSLEILEISDSALSSARKSLSGIIRKSASPEVQPLLFALLLGEKEGIDQDMRDLFARTGIAHVLAISGLHIGMVALFAFHCFRILFSRSTKILLSGRLFSLCALCTMVPVIYYGILTGMAPSTQRAIIMVGVFMLGYVFDRDYDSLNTLAVAAVLILAWHPPALFDVGFQLSFIAVFSILYGLKKVSFNTVPITWHEKIKRKAAIYILIPILAALGTLPIVLHYFDQLSLVGPIANLIVVPVVGFLVLPLCLTSSLMLPLFPWMSGLALKGAGLALQGILWIAHLMAAIPHASIMPIKPNLWEILLYYAALLSLIHIRKRWGQMLLILCLVGGIVDGVYWTDKRFGNEDLQVTFLDVGQGSSALIEFPRGPIMLVDGGGLSATSSFDTGRMIVAPYLWQRKIHTIDYLVLTHPQHDHAGGLGYMAERFKVGEFWSNGQPAPIEAYQRLLASCLDMKTAMPSLEKLHIPMEIEGVTCRVLHPAPGFEIFMDRDQKLNDNSLVLKLSMGSQSILFTGDIEKEGERLLVSRWGAEVLRSTACAAPHHGSKSSSSEAFVKAVDPQYVIFSTGARNWYGFPHREVVLRYGEADADMYNSGKQGACIFSTQGVEWEVETFSEKKQTIKPGTHM